MQFTKVKNNKYKSPNGIIFTEKQMNLIKKT